MKKSVFGYAAAALVTGFSLSWVAIDTHKTTRQENAPAPSPLAHANASYSLKPEKARAEYESCVAQNAATKVPEIQDHVGAAQMHLGYLAAKGKDLHLARQTFLAAAQTKGTGTIGEFGTVSDQAAYQAVVCLVAEGKTEEAKKGFEDYLRDRPYSSLVRAARGRLIRLNDGKTKPEWDALLQTAMTKQEVRIRFETSVCGPKCLEKITGRDYKTLAKLCGTTDAGTTVEGMRKGLKSLGLSSWAVRLNRSDFERATLPAVMLEEDHYVVIQRIENGKALAWDPRTKSDRSIQLPALDDPDFTATLILLSKPEGL